MRHSRGTSMEPHPVRLAEIPAFAPNGAETFLACLLHLYAKSLRCVIAENVDHLHQNAVFASLVVAVRLSMAVPMISGERKTQRTAMPSTMHLAANRATLGMEVRGSIRVRLGRPILRREYP